MKKLYHPKLLVGNLHNTDLALLRQVKFSAPNMYVRILPTGTKSQINTELEHLETIIQQFFSEKRGRFTVLASFSWEIKKYEYPHATILIESREMVGFHSPNNVRILQNIGCEVIKHLIRLTTALS